MAAPRSAVLAPLHSLPLPHGRHSLLQEGDITLHAGEISLAAGDQEAIDGLPGCIASAADIRALQFDASAAHRTPARNSRRTGVSQNHLARFGERNDVLARKVNYRQLCTVFGMNGTTSGTSGCCLRWRIAGPRVRRCGSSLQHAEHQLAELDKAQQRLVYPVQCLGHFTVGAVLGFAQFNVH